MKKFQKFCLTALSFLAVLALFAPPVAVSAQEVAFEPQQEYIEIVPYNTYGRIIRTSRVYSTPFGGGFLFNLHEGDWVPVQARLWIDGVQWLRLRPGQYTLASNVQ